VKHCEFGPCSFTTDPAAQTSKNDDDRIQRFASESAVRSYHYPKISLFRIEVEVFGHYACDDAGSSVKRYTRAYDVRRASQSTLPKMVAQHRHIPVARIRRFECPASSGAHAEQ